MLSRLRRPPPLSVRPLRAAEAADCAAIHAEGFSHPWGAGEFERLISAENTLGDGAFDPSGRLGGFVLSRRAADEAEILTIATARQARRRGAGKALLAAHLARLAGAGVRTLFLEVAEDNAAARGLYALYGFAEAGRRKGYYAHPQGRVDALILRRDLR